MILSRASGAVLGALALGGMLLASSVTAEAGARTGTWRNGMAAGPWGVGYYGGYRPYYPAYRPYYRRHDAGGAVAAGLIGAAFGLRRLLARRMGTQAEGQGNPDGNATPPGRARSGGRKA